MATEPARNPDIKGIGAPIGQPHSWICALSQLTCPADAALACSAGYSCDKKLA